MPIIIFSSALIFALVYLGYSYVKNLSVESLEYFINTKLPVISTCLVVTLFIICFIIITF